MRNFGFTALALLFAGGLWGTWPAIADSKQADPKSITSEADILPYLEQVIAWQRQAAAVSPTLGSARESLLKDSLAKGSGNVLKFSFAFARAEAQTIDQANPAGGDDTGSDQDGDKTRLQAAAVKVSSHVSDLQTQITTLTAQIQKTPTRNRPPLQAQLDDLKGQLKFATAQQDLLGNLLGVFNSMVSSANTGLSGKIASLSDTVSDKTPVDKAPDTTTAKSNTANSAPSSTGLLQVSEDLFKLWRQISDLRTLEVNANALRKTNKTFLDQLRTQIKSAITQSATVAATPTAPQPSLDSLLADFKQLSAAVVPVTQTDVWLDASAHTLQEWQQTVRDEIETLLRRLAIRLAVLGGLILIPVIVADLARRATERYVKDDKRQKQLRAVRRAVLTFTIVIIIVLNLVTEVGSFATFAGFIVGGLAVAFQNVLLSLVAFFFFYGRYSVRAGDRVSVSGVIGDVVHVGGLRFYVRELQEKEGKLEATGRVAAFPNSILFQTSAFFKYM